MKIAFVEIHNFRKLKSCRVDFAEQETVFVGANNSGKTSAMDALILFLKEKTKFSTRDFTLSNWKNINEIGKQWIEKNPITPEDLIIEKWQEYLPSLDIWINVENSEMHYVNHLIPTLDWQGGLLGIRLRLEPKNIEDLYKDFSTSSSSSKKVTEEANKQSKSSSISLKLWPATMWDFLERKLYTHFEIKAYILDPTKLTDPKNGEAQPQALSGSLPLDKAPFEGLIKIDIINAQRGFSDANSDALSSIKLTGNLSSQLREYYTKHLNPSEQPAASDIEALQSIENAKKSFDDRLKESFNESLKELETLNYPGFGNPNINISSQVNAIDGLKHDSAVQFALLPQNGIKDEYPLSLPEKYNGLGYQNLISMVFKLIRFRDEWMQVGKSLKAVTESPEFEPLHLVLVEEPEAHLHAQVQQVFIRKAYGVLRNHSLLKDKKFSTQLVVSTHSNHIAHEIDFTSLRYFRRKSAERGKVPTAIVVNLSKTFGTEDETTKFAIRYLKTTHCDLFFADAVILIEGPAERMLIPHFIKYHYPDLSTCYISLLEIGGSHAHKLRPLIQDLGIISLIVTDIDSIDPQNNRVSVKPEKGKGYETNNSTLKTWLPQKEKFDDLIALQEDAKQSKDFPIKVAYQIPFDVKFKNGNEEKEEVVLPYTFEDALVFDNIELFKTLTGNGLLKKCKGAANKTTAEEASNGLFEALTKNPKKAEFALELLYIQEPEKLKVPGYIAEGLKWVLDKLKNKQQDNQLTKEHNEQPQLQQ